MKAASEIKGQLQQNKNFTQGLGPKKLLAVGRRQAEIEKESCKKEN